MDFLINNWEAISAVVAALLLLAGIIVKKTSTPKDDAVLLQVKEDFTAIDTYIKAKKGGK